MRIIQKETNIGKIRKNNEDRVVAMTHPKNDEIHLLLVADGMGGKEHGELAAKCISDKIEKWFIKRNIKDFEDIETLQTDLEKEIHDANDEIIKEHGENKIGTTLSMAIILKDKTLITNIGDSRIYSYKRKKLIQLTEDDSDVWIYYKYGAVKKDDLRYFFNNNIITACIGISEKLCKISSSVIENDYEILLLFSDGVTDLITDSKIKKLIDTSKAEELLSNLINEAVNVDQHLQIPLRLRRKKYSKYILPFKGRDNASGTIYIK